MTTKINYPIAVALLLFLSLVLGLGLILPHYQDLKENSKKVEIAASELKIYKDYYQDLAQVSEKLEKYEAQLAKINSSFPSNPSLPSLLNFLEKTSSQTGLMLKGISPAAPAPSTKIEGLRETSLGLIVSGSYYSFKNFLSILEKSARFIQIESISFSAEEKPETPINFNLRIKVYSY